MHKKLKTVAMTARKAHDKCKTCQHLTLLLDYLLSVSLVIIISTVFNFHIPTYYTCCGLNSSSV